MIEPKKREKKHATAIRRLPNRPAVAAISDSYPEAIRRKLLILRKLILSTASVTRGVGKLDETLKWGQPSFLTSQSGSGTTIRIDGVKREPGQYAIYFHCQTNLVETFRELYPREFNYGGNRCIIFNENDAIPVEAVRHCVSLALTYHHRKAATAKGNKNTR